MKKVVLKVDFYDDRTKQKAMKTVSGLSGVESVSVDMKDKKMSLEGEVDPVHVVAKLRKFCKAEMVSVGPVKKDQEPENDSNINYVIESYPLHDQITPPHYYYQYCYVCGRR